MASFLSAAGPAMICSPAAAQLRRLVVTNTTAKTAEVTKSNGENKQESNNRRRDLMTFAAAAAAMCSVAGIALADEPKRGTAEAKKAYAPVCVTMPTARICRN